MIIYNVNISQHTFPHGCCFRHKPE